MGTAGGSFSIGGVLGHGFRIWLKNLIPFLLITIVIYLPVLIWGISIVQGEPEFFAYLASLQRFERASLAIGSISNILVSAALTYGVVMELQGQRASLGACVGTGFARLLPVLGVAILVTLIVLLGFVALIIPGIILFCMFYVTTPVAVIERVGVTGALSRSKELTSGRKMHIFGLLILLGLLNFAVSMTAEKVLLDPSTLTETSVYAAVRTFMYVALALDVVITSLSAVMMAVAYVHLRNEKEGTSAAELAAVFE